MLTHIPKSKYIAFSETWAVFTNSYTLWTVFLTPDLLAVLPYCCGNAFSYYSFKLSKKISVHTREVQKRNAC